MLEISIHVLRVEDDSFSGLDDAPVTVFQSTSSVWRTTPRQRSLVCPVADFNPRPPCGGRPAALCLGALLDLISIHVLRVEDDSKNREKSLFAFIIIQQFVQICN